MEENRFSFIVSDESINKYGTRVLTNGIDLSEFRKNPVLFWNHKRDEDGIFGASAKNHYPIGRWENIRMDGENLKADAVLDLNDATGKKVAQKLKDGFLNAASIGIAVVGTSESEEFLLAGQTRPTITQSKLLEISIVDIPANGNAMRLSYEGEMLRFDANEDKETLNKILPKMENQTEETAAPAEEVKLSAADIATNAVQAFWSKIKESFNLSPKKEGVTTEQAEDIVKTAFVELKADFEGFTAPAPIDNSAEIQALKESNEAFKATLDEMKSELVQLKGKKGGEAGNDAAPLSNKTTAPTLSAHEKALASAGKFFSKKYKNR
jgi:HK97 family phage prohead protease